MSNSIVQLFGTPTQTAGLSTPGNGKNAALPTIAVTTPNKISKTRSSNLQDLRQMIMLDSSMNILVLMHA